MTFVLIAGLALIGADPDDAALMKSDDQAVQRGFTTQRRTIPAAFQGTFRNSQEECAATESAGLAVSPTRIALPEAEADVVSVRVEGPRKLIVSSIYESSTEVWEKSETFLLSRDGNRLALISPAGSATRVRCSAK